MRCTLALVIVATGCGFSGHGTVDATGPGGEASDALLTIVDTPADAAGLAFSYVVEAETFTSSVPVMAHAWQVVTTTPGYLGTGYVQDLPGNGFPCVDGPTVSACSAYLTYAFSLPKPGMYYLHAKVAATSNSDDSFWLGMDGQAWENANVLQNVGFQWRTLSTPKMLTSGSHAIYLWAREAGVQVDRIALDALPTPPP
ncbi:MAG: hypothetical protein NT062_21810 [Proteobacteria bacterium]|nr:hypothetical protein [Pseudomonadota bacterium]